MISKNLGDLVAVLARVGDSPEHDDRERQWRALSAVIGYMETLPLTGQEPSLLQPLRQLCSELAPDLGRGRGNRADYTIKAAALGTVAALRADGVPIGEARSIVAAILTKAGEPASPRKVRSWTEGDRADWWRGMVEGTLIFLRPMCRDDQQLGEFAKGWLDMIVRSYR